MSCQEKYTDRQKSVPDLLLIIVSFFEEDLAWKTCGFSLIPQSQFQIGLPLRFLSKTADQIGRASCRARV